MDQVGHKLLQYDCFSSIRLFKNFEGRKKYIEQKYNIG